MALKVAIKSALTHTDNEMFGGDFRKAITW